MKITVIGLGQMGGNMAMTLHAAGFTVTGTDVADAARDNLAARGLSVTRLDALLAMRPYVEQHLRDGGTLHHISRHVLGLAQGFPGARRFRQLLSTDLNKVQDPLGLLDQAAELLRGH